MPKLPDSAADARPGRPAPASSEAYFRNPIADRPLLTPYEAIDAISLLSATLVADERYRMALMGRQAPL